MTSCLDDRGPVDGDCSLYTMNSYMGHLGLTTVSLRSRLMQLWMRGRLVMLMTEKEHDKIAYVPLPITDLRVPAPANNCLAPKMVRRQPP